MGIGKPGELAPDRQARVLMSPGDTLALRRWDTRARGRMLPGF